MQKYKHASEEGSSNNIERFMPSLGNLIGSLGAQDDSDYEKCQ